MSGMSAPAAGGRGRPPRGVARALLTLVAVTAAFAVGTGFWAAGSSQVATRSVVDVVIEVILTAWALVPFLAIWIVVVKAARRTHSYMTMIALGVVALTVLTVAALVNFLASDSSTAALVFLVLPFYQLLVVGAAAAAGLRIPLLVRRRHQRRSRPGGP